MTNNMDGKELLCILLLREDFDKNNPQVNFYSNEEIYQAILTKFLKEEKTFSLSSINVQKLNNWLKEKYRYPLLNDLIKHEINKLTTTQNDSHTADFFLIKNLNFLLEIMIEEVGKSLKNEMLYDKTNEITLPKLCTEEFTILLAQFLKQIDPTLEWYNIYEKACQTGQIIYVDKNDFKTKQKIFTDFDFKSYGLTFENLKWNISFIINNTPYLIIEKNNNLADLWFIAHEFAHFIQMLKCPKIARTLDEFASITYEQACLSFLETKGYNKKVINQMHNERNTNTFQIGILTLKVFEYIEKLLNNKVITKKADIEEAKEIVDLNKIYFRDLEKNSPWMLDSLKYSEYFCDNTILYLIKNTDDISHSYPYIIGNYLATLANENLNNGNLSFSDLKALTENSDKPSYVLKRLGLNSKVL